MAVPPGAEVAKAHGLATGGVVKLVRDAKLKGISPGVMIGAALLASTKLLIDYVGLAATTRRLRELADLLERDYGGPQSGPH